MDNEKKKSKVTVINVGLQGFYDAIAAQNVDVIQLDWRIPFKPTDEMKELLDMFL